MSIENNTTPWRYEKAMGAYKYCTFNGGECLVKNQITKNEPMNIDEYLIQRANAMNKSQIECQEKRKQKTWQNNSKYISYEKDKSIKEILSIENNTTPWRYEKAMGAYKYCTFNGGVCLVKNQITKNEPMNIDEYLIQRANAMNKSQIECPHEALPK